MLLGFAMAIPAAYMGIAGGWPPGYLLLLLGALIIGAALLTPAKRFEARGLDLESHGQARMFSGIPASQLRFGAGICASAGCRRLRSRTYWWPTGTETDLSHRMLSNHFMTKGSGMPASLTRPNRAPLLADGETVVLFDGVCKLCNGWAKFLIRHDRDHLVRLATV
nr:hypothetical protein [Tanacetum cinerariifolium]